MYSDANWWWRCMSVHFAHDEDGRIVKWKNFSGLNKDLSWIRIIICILLAFGLLWPPTEIPIMASYAPSIILIKITCWVFCCHSCCGHLTRIHVFPGAPPHPLYCRICFDNLSRAHRRLRMSSLNERYTYPNSKRISGNSIAPLLHNLAHLPFSCSLIFSK